MLSAERWERRWTMRLHLMRASFIGSSSAHDQPRGSGGGGASSAGPGCPCPIVMDAGVWGKMPDDILWKVKVLLLLPAAKQVQLHLLSRSWRRLLTSAHFHNTCAAAAAGPEVQGDVVFATRGGKSACGSRRAVDIDLTFLPRDFFYKLDAEFMCLCESEWLPDQLPGVTICIPYYVLAAGDDMVCVASHRMLDQARLCVLNPLTRTYKMLPAMPWDTCTATGTAGATVTALIVRVDETRRVYADWEVATCGLTGGGAAEWTVRRGRVHAPDEPAGVHEIGPGLKVAMCGSKMVWYLGECKRVLVAGLDDAPSARTDALLDAPSVELLGLDAATTTYGRDVFLVAHRGSVFLVAYLQHPSPGGYPHEQAACGVWRRQAHKSREP